MQTFQVTASSYNTFTNAEVLPSVASDAYNLNRAVLALFNSTGSNKIIKIRKISFYSIGYTNSTLTQPNLIPITGYTGYDLDSDAITISKFSSANEALPSTVEVRTSVIQATEGTGSLCRYTHTPSWLPGLALSQTAWYRRHILWSGDEVSDVQKIVLRNGEGFALKEANQNDCLQFPYRIEAMIRLSDTGSCYSIEGYTSSNFPYPFVIFNNGYTSGQVEILKIRIEEARSPTIVIGTSDSIPLVDIALVDMFQATYTGHQLTPLKLDSRNVLDSNIKLYGDADISFAFGRAGSQAVNVFPMRVVPITTTSAAPSLMPDSVIQEMFRAIPGETDMVVREGQGIAILLPSAGAVGSPINCSMVFTQEEAMADIFMINE